jgi:hypothetical protein
MATTGQDIGWARPGLADAAPRSNVEAWFEALRRSGTPGRIAALILLWGLTVVALYPLV